MYEKGLETIAQVFQLLPRLRCLPPCYEQSTKLYRAKSHRNHPSKSHYSKLQSKSNAPLHGQQKVQIRKTACLSAPDITFGGLLRLRCFRRDREDVKLRDVHSLTNWLLWPNGYSVDPVGRLRLISLLHHSQREENMS